MEIAKLSLSPEDFLVVKLDYPVSEENSEAVKKRVRDLTGHNKVLVMGGGISLCVLSVPAADAASAA